MAQPKPSEVFPSQSGSSQVVSFFSALFQTGFEPNTAASNSPAPGTANDSTQAPSTSVPGEDGANEGLSCPLNLPFLFEQLTAQLLSAPGVGRSSTKANSTEGTACSPADSRKSRSGTAPVRLSSLTPKILTVLPLAAPPVPSNPEAATTTPAPAAPWNLDPAAQHPLRSVVSNAPSIPSAATNGPSAPTVVLPEAAIVGMPKAIPGAGNVPPIEMIAPVSLAPENAPVVPLAIPWAVTDTASILSSPLTPGTLVATDTEAGSATKLFALPHNGDGDQPASGSSRNAGGVHPNSSSSPAVSNGVDGGDVRKLQAAHAAFEFARIQVDGAAKGQAAPSSFISKPAAPSEAAKPALQADHSTAAALSTSPVQAAVGAGQPPSPALHPFVQPQTAGGPVASDATIAATVKSQPKDSSNGSESGDSEKTGRPSGNQVVHGNGNGNGFSPSLEAANSNSEAPHPAAALPAVPVVDPRVPLEARAGNVEVPPDKSSAATSSGSQALPPAPAADQPVVSGAQLMGRAGQAEIHIEMQAGPLGAVDLRARVSGDQVGASIAVEHRDAQIMLSNELPTLHVALAEKNLRVNTLSVSQGMGTSTGGGLGNSPGQKESTPFHPRQVYAAENEITAPAPDARAGSLETPLPGVRLSIRA